MDNEKAVDIIFKRIPKGTKAFSWNDFISYYCISYGGFILIAEEHKRQDLEDKLKNNYKEGLYIIAELNKII